MDSTAVAAAVVGAAPVRPAPALPAGPGPLEAESVDLRRREHPREPRPGFSSVLSNPAAASWTWRFDLYPRACRFQVALRPSARREAVRERSRLSHSAWPAARP